MTLHQATILIVDDEPILRLTFGLLLRQQGATTYEAGDGVEALGVLRSEPIDLMITDKQMPGMDGITLLRTMAAEKTGVPSILFVSAVSSESQEELARLQIMETLTKPIHPEDLIRVVARTIQHIPQKS